MSWQVSRKYGAAEKSRYFRMRILRGRRFGSWPAGRRLTKKVREPSDSTLLCTNWFSPPMMAATVITEVTPITIPRMVSADRTLCERKVSMATSRFSTASARVTRRSLPVAARNWGPINGTTNPATTNRDATARERISFGPQCHYRVQFGCACGRIDSKKQSDHGAEHQSQNCNPSLHGSWKRCES